ncbi:MAG TPA: dienelactone hydrolase family protein [Steroidobacteraceae bacterium]|nr:dienelactone hydrolase family protein [Steroidobacteraceae bacterium]
MSDYLDIRTPDGNFHAYRVLPKAAKAPAVVVVQEIFGINADMKETCRWVADQGFIAVCPDLFWRIEPGVSMSSLNEAEWKKAFALYQAFDRDRGVADIAATMDHARGLAQASGSCAVMGFCLGGLMTFLTAARQRPDAAVSYYGGETDKYLGEMPSVHKPLLMHLAEEDEYIAPPARERIVKAAKSNPMVTVHTYPKCNHAFARHNGVHYDAAAAALANSRSSEFLRRHLA